MLTPEQAAAGLVPLIGGAGISGVLIAFIGYLTAVRSGRPKAEAPVISFSGVTPGTPFDREAIDHLGTIAYGVIRLVAIMELRAEVDMKDPPGFRERLDDKNDRLIIEAIKAWILKKG